MKSYIQFTFILVLLIIIPGFSIPNEPVNIQTLSKCLSEKHGLVFQNESKLLFEEKSFTEIIQLFSLDSKLHALQFRIFINSADEDSTILIFESLEKGSEISDASWILDYNVIEGPVMANGASKDEVLVLLYNLDPDGCLEPGNYNDLIDINFRIPKSPTKQDSIKSSLIITNAEGSTFDGFPINISPSRNELTIILKDDSIFNKPSQKNVSNILFQNYPNPFNPSTTIQFSVFEKCKVVLKIFNALGVEIKTLIDEEKYPGNYSVMFEAEKFPSGIYFYCLRTKNLIQTKKMLLVR